MAWAILYGSIRVFIIFIRQCNGRALNPDMLQVLTAIYKHICKDMTAYLFTTLKGNVEPGRAQELLKQIAGSASTVSSARDKSFGEQYRQAVDRAQRSEELSCRTQVRTS